MGRLATFLIFGVIINGVVAGGKQKASKQRSNEIQSIIDNTTDIPNEDKTIDNWLKYSGEILTLICNSLLAVEGFCRHSLEN